MKTAEFANSVDLGEVAHYEPPHLDLHCLPSSLGILCMIQLGLTIFSSPGRSPGRAIVLPRALVSASAAV